MTTNASAAISERGLVLLPFGRRRFARGLERTYRDHQFALDLVSRLVTCAPRIHRKLGNLASRASLLQRFLPSGTVGADSSSSFLAGGIQATRSLMAHSQFDQLVRVCLNACVKAPMLPDL